MRQKFRDAGRNCIFIILYAVLPGSQPAEKSGGAALESFFNLSKTEVDAADIAAKLQDILSQRIWLCLLESRLQPTTRRNSKKRWCN